MKVFSLVINGKETGVTITTADTFFSKLLGLMGKKSVDRGLFIPRCGSIHTFFMKIDIDAVFLDVKGSVKRIVPGIKPWKIVFPVPQASATLELAAGSALKLGIRENDLLTLMPPAD